VSTNKPAPRKRIVQTSLLLLRFLSASLLLKTIFHRKDVNPISFSPFEELHGGTPRHTPCFYADGNPTKVRLAL